MKANWTNVVMGLALGVCLTLLIGAATPSSIEQDGAQTGRGPYQISSSGNVAWVVNTQTGQVWVTEKRTVEPDSPMVYVEKATWYAYGTPLDASR